MTWKELSEYYEKLKEDKRRFSSEINALQAELLLREATPTDQKSLRGLDRGPQVHRPPALFHSIRMAGSSPPCRLGASASRWWAARWGSGSARAITSVPSSPVSCRSSSSIIHLMFCMLNMLLFGKNSALDGHFQRRLAHAALRRRRPLPSPGAHLSSPACGFLARRAQFRTPKPQRADRFRALSRKAASHVARPG